MTADTLELHWQSLVRRKQPTWFSRAKFGIFVHWGVYSVPAWTRIRKGRYASYAEWYQVRVMGELADGESFHRTNYGNDFEYRDFARQFRAELFDPAQWAELFQAAAARYVVLTAKHHDGFCLWPTANGHKRGWNSGDIGPHRDLVGELTAAVRMCGLKMGLYYSLPEWETHRTGRTPSGCHIAPATIAKHGVPHEDYVDAICLPELRELVQRYQPALLFADGGEWDFDERYWKTTDFLAWLYATAPNRDEVVVNDRWCKGMPGRFGDYFSSEYQDRETFGAAQPWEESRGMGLSYGYNRAERLEHYRTSAELIHELIRVVSCGGNFLLNIGPRADGGIPVIMEERLRQIGRWLAVNGEAIFDTEPWVHEAVQAPRDSAESFCTKRGPMYYAIRSRWPGDRVFVPRPHGLIAGIDMLGGPIDLRFEATPDQLIVGVPPISPDKLPPQEAYTFRIRCTPTVPGAHVSS